jgi:hypothetical protein
MSASIEETATTVVKNLANIETALIVLFEQQQHLSTGLLSRTDERSISASQLHLLLQVKSAVQVARLAVWSLVVPEAPEVAVMEESEPELTVYHCEPEAPEVADDDEEEGEVACL